MPIHSDAVVTIILVGLLLSHNRGKNCPRLTVFALRCERRGRGRLSYDADFCLFTSCGARTVVVAYVESKEGKAFDVGRDLAFLAHPISFFAAYREGIEVVQGKDARRENDGR